MLADIEDPPRSRVPGMLVGIVVALPIAAVFVVWVVPTLIAAVLGGAQNFDDALANEKAYMDGVCTEALQVPRDEALCECVLATEYAALDCQAPFMTWALERQQEYCEPPETKKAALSYCTCVETVAQDVAAAESEAEANKIAQNFRNCQTLPDAVDLPSVEALNAGQSPS